MKTMSDTSEEMPDNVTDQPLVTFPGIMGQDLESFQPMMDKEYLRFRHSGAS
jgi:hypothetical protein